MIVRTILSLALVLGLIALLAWIAKRAMKSDRWSLSRSRGSLKVVERYNLDSKRSLWVVDWNNRRFLLGATDSSLVTLDRIENTSSQNSEITSSEGAMQEGRA